MSRLARCSLATLLLLVPSWAHAKDPQIWYVPTCHWRNATPDSEGMDFWDLFATPNVHWRTAQSRVHVLEIMVDPPLMWWAYLRQGRNATPAQREAYLDQPQYLPRLFTFLQDRHIALCMGFEVVHGPRHLEGVDPHAAENVERICRQIHRDGGVLDYAGLDEPLCFGHYNEKGPRYSIEEFFDRTKGNLQGSIATIKKYFPKVKFVEAEPINSYDWVYAEAGVARYADDFAAWTAAFKQHTGSPISALQLDIWWPRPLKPVVRRLCEKVLRPQGVLLGVMFNGDGRAKTDAEAIAACKEHIRYWHALGLPEPDQVLMQDWFEHPSKNLPETDATAFTSMINWYVDNISQIKWAAGDTVEPKPPARDR